MISTDQLNTGLRSNGLLVYVPNFNCKGIVYLTDADGRFLRSAFPMDVLRKDAFQTTDSNVLQSLVDTDHADAPDLDDAEET